MATAEPLCSSCNSIATTKCQHCRCSRYCSKACQEADWATHKLLCKDYRDFHLSSRPTTEHFLAIFFPPDERKPRIHCPWRDDDDDDDDEGPWQAADSRPYIQGCLGQAQIQFNKALARPLPDTIRIDYRDSGRIDGSPPNLACDSLCARRGIVSGRCGPVLAYGMQGLGVDQNVSRDLDLSDFRHVVDFLLADEMTTGIECVRV
ncbi:hypothetical protein SLS58_007127 [Diplodia intermedia]|uniref:MYND-type domain-containing protein n=1 Tax=Diplodia intermedia TaxID=856260 RepID=A0ABR3TKT0_9PEZI